MGRPFSEPAAVTFDHRAATIAAMYRRREDMGLFD